MVRWWPWRRFPGGTSDPASTLTTPPGSPGPWCWPASGSWPCPASSVRCSPAAPSSGGRWWRSTAIPEREPRRSRSSWRRRPLPPANGRPRSSSTPAWVGWRRERPGSSSSGLPSSGGCPPPAGLRWSPRCSTGSASCSPSCRHTHGWAVRGGCLPVLASAARCWWRWDPGPPRPRSACGPGARSGAAWMPARVRSPNATSACTSTAAVPSPVMSRSSKPADGTVADGMAERMAERIACLWCPTWPVVALRARDPTLYDVPVAVVERGERGLVVIAASTEAVAEGVTPGLRRREAEARCPDLVVAEADPQVEARAFERVARAVESFTPRFVLEAPGRLAFPTRGPSRYFGGDTAMAARCLDAVRGIGITDARVGVADGGFAAMLAARTAEPGAAYVVPPGESSGFLAPWPVAVLEDPEPGEAAELADLLVRLGLRTLGAFAALPDGAVLGRFGSAGARAHRLARGDDDLAASPAPPPPELFEIAELDPPAVHVETAAFAAKALAERPMARLGALGLACTRVMIEAETERGERLTRCWRHEGALTPAALAARVRWQLEGWLTAEVGDDGSVDDLATD